MPDVYGKFTENELRSLAVDGIIHVPVSSSAIDSLTFDTVASILVVTLNTGNDVAYMPYPFDEFVKFVNADSKGSFYNHYVKGHYIKAY